MLDVQDRLPGRRARSPATTSCPTTCRWCSTSPRLPPRGERLLRAHRADLEAAAARPRAGGTPYVDVVAAVCAQLPRLGPPRDRARAQRVGGRAAARGGRAGAVRPAGVPEPATEPETMSGTTAAQVFWWVALPYLALGDLRRRARLAVALRPVRLDQPLHPAAGAPPAQVGRPALPLRHLRRHRRARHRRPDPRALDHARSASPRTSTGGSPPAPARWPRCWSSPAWWSWPAGGCSSPGSGPPPAPVDYVALILLLIVILTGIAPTIGVNLLGHGYDYRTTVAPWFRGLFVGHPDVTADRARAAHLPGARHRRVADLGGVAVQPARARLELPAVVPVAALHRLPQPPRRPARRARHQRPPVAQDRRPLLGRRRREQSPL